MSPHEMSTARIEEIVNNYRRLLEEPDKADQEPWVRQYWQGSLINYEKLLKERADAGVI